MNLPMYLLRSTTKNVRHQEEERLITIEMTAANEVTVPHRIKKAHGKTTGMVSLHLTCRSVTRN